MNLIKTDTKRRETRQTLLQPIRKATSVSLHKRKPALPQPWETSHWPLAEKVGWAERCQVWVRFGLSGEVESAAEGSRWRSPVCWAHFDVARVSCLSIVLHSRLQRKELHCCFRVKETEWEVKTPSWAGRPSGDELAEKELQVILWHRVDSKSFPLALLLLEARERHANFQTPWLLPPKEQEIMGALKENTRQTHGSQPEGDDTQTMTTAVIKPWPPFPMQDRVDRKQPVFLGWKSNPHPWRVSLLISWKGPHVNLGPRNLSMPVTQPLKGAKGTELVGLSDGFVRCLLAARSHRAEWQPCSGHRGEILIVTDAERVIKSVWKVSQKTEKLKRERS